MYHGLVERRGNICDMIKGMSRMSRYINFEIQAWRGDKFLCFTLFLSFKELFISPQPDVRLRWGLDQNVAFKMDKWFIFKKTTKLKIANMWLIPLDCVTYRHVTTKE